MNEEDNNPADEQIIASTETEEQEYLGGLKAMETFAEIKKHQAEIKKQRDYLRELKKSEESNDKTTGLPFSKQPFTVEEVNILKDIVNLRLNGSYSTLARNLMSTGSESKLVEIVDAFDKMSLKDVSDLKDNFGINALDISKACKKSIESIRSTHEHVAFAKQLKSKQALADGSFRRKLVANPPPGLRITDSGIRNKEKK